MRASLLIIFPLFFSVWNVARALLCLMSSSIQEKKLEQVRQFIHAADGPQGFALHEEHPSFCPSSWDKCKKPEEK